MLFAGSVTILYWKKAETEVGSDEMFPIQLIHNENVIWPLMVAEVTNGRRPNTMEELVRFDVEGVLPMGADGLTVPGDAKVPGDAR
jgi:hypothetical protein